MEQNIQGFRPIYIAAMAFGLAFVILVGIWTGGYLGGFAWRSTPELQFNWHPLLMSIGMIFLYSNSMLIYRSYRSCCKRTLKIAHSAIHGLIFLLTIIALIAVFDSHNLHMKDGQSDPIPNMYSLHSWIGLTAVILFACQLLSGFVTYLYPGLTSNIKTTYMPVHTFFGIAIFICVVAAALLGLSEKGFFVMKSNYADLPAQGVLLNSIGICLIIFTGLTTYLVTEKSYKRIPLPEDEFLLTSHDK
ncbi:cytochrome b561-like [Ctenocephalides felis]|uniref:cytochrome b561-like n=1 Tax=Ctenocephalides felis TaxID=7515 RepID=UPI000E6E30BC|nr:cytochrome b561-like [Ctenocephalides felis]